ncbi:MAG TPA: hypothetical protein VGN97_01130 [Mesorhizobium sp.]|jgi:predicted alpha/beta-hydrolase family hydrolase|nr:hypothetical protein [Mesorhizobium sp.]
MQTYIAMGAILAALTGFLIGSPTHVIVLAAGIGAALGAAFFTLIAEQKKRYARAGWVASGPQGWAK